MTMKNNRFQLILTALIFALVVASPAAARTGSTPSAQSYANAAKAGCAGADTPTTDIRRFRKAVSCLHNLERRHHGLGSLRMNSDLSRVAAKHARDMVRRHYFEHLSPSHRDHMDRIAASRYKPSAGRWSAGENLYFSRGIATPRQMMSAWMKSPAHRRNILMGCWHDFGLGVVKTSPYGERAGLTVVALFGTRSCH